MAKRGRPTKYKKSYIKKVDEYLEQCKDEIEKTSKYEGAQGSTEYDVRLKVNLPTVEGFSIYLKVPLRCIWDWAKVHKDFSHALEDIKRVQKERLITQGLAGVYNSTIAKLILSANHDMREKKDVTSGDKPIKSNTIIVKDFSEVAEEDDVDEEEEV